MPIVLINCFLLNFFRSHCISIAAWLAQPGATVPVVGLAYPDGQCLRKHTKELAPTNPVTRYPMHIMKNPEFCCLRMCINASCVGRDWFGKVKAGLKQFVLGSKKEGGT